MQKNILRLIVYWAVFNVNVIGVFFISCLYLHQNEEHLDVSSEAKEISSDVSSYINCLQINQEYKGEENMEDWHKLQYYLLACPCSQESCTPRWTCMHISPGPVSWQEHIAVLFRRAQFMHYVVEQSQCKNCAAFPRKMSLMWWKCIKLTGRAEANVSVAAGQDAACLPAFQCNLGHFIEFCHW